MSLYDLTILFLSMFSMVFLLGFQSKNIHRSKYVLAAITSFFITLTNFFFVSYAAEYGGFLFILVSGLGGSLGIMTSIWIHDNFVGKKDNKKFAGYVYLAGPYSHDEDHIQQYRFEELTREAAELGNMGMIVFSPITHGHPMAERHELPGDYEYWKKHCEAFVSRADIVHVLMLPGWEESVGVQAEIDLAEELGIPVRYFAHNASYFAQKS